ncbi:peptidyl-prolyl cis-trans isomerase (cyclophilin) [Pontimonas salivibrio]|uniref:Peptidyl-prolyl cis-trans isomerase n=1 Tax=Pontimonas salivibrio TaxID=1159327 RepID=A0A2L2BNE0_9MICO|nr:peptidylprolyl isomerase [Pontimonas salivibrio]AVG23190.1 peptidyl-prolyl cis-trans isomerase (cyclophilin) [Pontimonas salivibrio]
MTLHTHLATLHTNHGDIRLGLFENHAPKTVKNFVGLATGDISWTHPTTGESVSEPLYTDVIFHRVIPGFMIQGGDPLGTGTGGPGYQFDDEIHPELSFNESFLLAMANAGKRGGQGTNGSQFFITTAATPWLQGNHTIFGVVLDEESQGVVKAIEATPTGANDRPVDDVIIHRVSISDA